MKTYHIFIIALLPILIACNKGEEATTDATQEDINILHLTSEQIDIAGIQTGKPEQRAISKTIRVNGMLDVPPQHLVTIAAPMGGFVKETHLLQGMWVKKGESVVELQDQAYIQLQQDYLESKSQLAFAETEFRRQETLASENVNAQKTLQQAKATYESLRARVEGLKARLAIINIDPEKLTDGNIRKTIHLYSPIAGYVTDVNVNLGQFVNATDELFKIVDTGHLHAELYVFEQDIPHLKVNQRVAFTLINENKTRMAHVYLIGREINAERTIRVHCHLDEEDKNLLPGMYVKATIIADTREVNTLPEEAIVNFEGTSYVFVTSDQQTFTMTPVTTGGSEDGYVEVTLPYDWNSSHDVVVKGAYDLLSRLKNTEEEE